MYSYRMCTDDSIVQKFIDPAHTPDQGEMDDLEACFQKGILRCDGVEGNDCSSHPDCEGTGWGRAVR